MQPVLHQVLDGLEFMHIRAMAHLNVRAESVIFSNEGTAKLVGLCCSEIYFNADTETFFKLQKTDRRREYLPVEVYLDEPFAAEPVDVYSFGFLLYAVISDLRKKSRPRRIGHVEYGNLPDGPIRSFVEDTTNRQPAKRAKMTELKSKPYFKAD